MTAPFVTEIRTTDDVIRIAGASGSLMHLRVQVAELWDTVRIEAAGTTSVAEVKNAALAAFFPVGVNSGEFVTKLRGFEILNEGETLEASGVRDGSTILLARRRRRPVK
jgi:hypothetical protein